MALLTALILAALPVAAADQTYRVIEQAIEARADAVVLPSGAVGILVVTRCEGCAPASFATNAETRYLSTSGPTTLVDLRAGLRRAPRSPVTVFYDAQSRAITRVVANVGIATPAGVPR
ncbi:MAG: hypothetical protein AB7G76_06215 [Steroidobacteraceae bacterium]